MAVSNTLLPPKRSPSQPEAGMNTARLTRYAMTTPSTAVGAMPKSRPIVGRATLTMVMSMMFMNIADTNTAPTTTFWLRRGATAKPFLYRNDGGGAVTRSRDAGITLLGSCGSVYSIRLLSAAARFAGPGRGGRPTATAAASLLAGIGAVA